MFVPVQVLTDVLRFPKRRRIQLPRVNSCRGEYQAFGALPRGRNDPFQTSVCGDVLRTNVRGPNRVSNWALEVIIQNTPVVEAFKQLEHAGLAEVKYLWGNHDAYLGREAVTFQLDLPQHLPTFSARKGDLFCEHGHRFDRSNFDNTDYGFTSGPSVSKKVYQYPILREAEDFGREFTSIGHPSKQLDCHLLGATLIYLYQRYDLGKNPFSIYIMGHSHKHNLLRFNVRAEFHLYNGSG